jgi:WD40 repeat protein
MIANCQIFVLCCVVGMVWSYTYSSYGVASPSSTIYCVDISPDGELVAVGTDEPFIKIYYLDNQTLVSSVAPTAIPRSVKFSPDQSFLIVTT